jgi:hypothetical protein
LRRALLATVQMVHWLAGETAVQLGLDYPRSNDLQVLGWITTSLST